MFRLRDDAAEALEIRWIPSLGQFLPSYVRSAPSLPLTHKTDNTHARKSSDAPYPSQPSAPTATTVIRFAPASHVRVWADSSRETELFPWSISSVRPLFPSLSLSLALGES